MILGQSAATAAAQALEEGRPAQRIDYARLRARLLADGQILEWTKGAVRSEGNPAPARATLYHNLKGIVLDETEGRLTGEWAGGALAPIVGAAYLHDNNAGKGAKSIAWSPEIPEAGEYELVLLAPPNPNRASNVPVVIRVGEAPAVTVKIDERNASSQGHFPLGRFKLGQGRTVQVIVSNAGTDGHVVVDGLQLRPVK